MPTRSAVFAALLLCTTSKAQVIHSQADGPWEESATWDCSCIPGATDAVVIDHAVTSIATQIYLEPVSLTISSGASFHPAWWVGLGCPTDVQGSLHAPSILLTWPNSSLTIAGLVSTIDLGINAPVTLGSTGHISVTNSLYIWTDGTLDGAGSICVNDSTLNEGAISGTLDLCDLSPSGFNPPLEVNTGTVATTVTFCTNTDCVARVEPIDPLAQVSIRYDAGAGSLALVNLPAGTRTAELVDALGQITVRELSTTGRMDVKGMAPGWYTVVLRNHDSRHALPVVID